jgi:hypothetical protein
MVSYVCRAATRIPTQGLLIGSSMTALPPVLAPNNTLPATFKSLRFCFLKNKMLALLKVLLFHLLLV